ncbi:hypothetical protein ACFQ5J_00035 [Lacticaseibacillus baoqingensis]|uniref:DUF2313 domain-containing protein n=1 Tax=Lacticaseibacillus baoqingensis TaxID=2486013 RepID=A0ABW4E152_9LACO|nr:hypothetical protein [Lacticaseibacillus baoqingensis]
MNDQDLIELAALTLQQRDGNATALETALHIPVAAIQANEAALLPQQREQLRFLFSDYEWMLAQKLAVLQSTAPAAGTLAQRYQLAKTVIAKAWLRSPSLTTSYVKEPRSTGRVSVHLQLRQDYGVHGLVDILDFVVPTQVAKQLQTKQLDLLTWADAHLEDSVK